MSPWVPREGAASVGKAVWTAPGGGGGGAERCAPVMMSAVSAGVGAAVGISRLVVIPVTDPQILLLVRGETQETAGSPGPGALQPRDPAQDLPKPSPPGAQCHQQAASKIACWSLSSSSELHGSE